jgi:uncharacterized membrane protein
MRFMTKTIKLCRVGFGVLAIVSFVVCVLAGLSWKLNFSSFLLVLSACRSYFVKRLGLNFEFDCCLICVPRDAWDLNLTLTQVSSLRGRF